jgi:hypothetical protein
MMMGGCSLVMTSPPLKNYVRSLDTSTTCTAPEFVNAFVRSKAHAIEQEVQKLCIVQDPKIHYDLLRFCQHTRLAFLALGI